MTATPERDQPVLAASIPVRPAATVMLVRDGDDGLEVFMLHRTHGAAFARSQYVFPGGKVDAEDHGEVFEPICDGLDDATASARMGMDHGGLAWLVAATRECFEEAGVLLARPVGSDDVVWMANAATTGDPEPSASGGTSSRPSSSMKRARLAPCSRASAR